VIEITLIRHGETEYNREMRIQGRLDSPLTEAGRNDAIRLGRKFRTTLHPVDAWYESPLGRVNETATILRGELDRPPPTAIVCDELREIDCGDYEGRTEETMDQEYRRRLRIDPATPYPGGESILDVMKRGERFLDRLLRDAHGFPDSFHAVVIAHGNFNRSFGSVLTGLGPHFALRVVQGNTAVNRLFTRDRQPPFRIRTWNDLSHLDPATEER